MLALHKPNALRSTDLSRRSGPLKATYPVERCKEQEEIRFYDRGDPYYEFTNFYPCHVVIDGKTWTSTEHYFQAQKFVGTPYAEVIRHFPTAREAFQLSRTPQVSRWCRGDWEQVKDDIMLKALRCKFNNNSELKRKLLATGNQKLIEHTHNDSYWGDGGDGSGKNKLGKLLERVRSELQMTHVSPPHDAANAASRDMESNNSSIFHERRHDSVPMNSPDPASSLQGVRLLANAENQQPSLPTHATSPPTLKRSVSFSFGQKPQTTAVRPVRAFVSRENLPTEIPKYVSSTQSHSSSKRDHCTSYEPPHTIATPCSLPRPDSCISTDNERATFSSTYSSTLRRSSSLSRLCKDTSACVPDRSNPLQGALACTGTQLLSVVSKDALPHRTSTRSNKPHDCTTQHTAGRLEECDHSCGSKNSSLIAPQGASSHQGSSLRRSNSLTSSLSANREPTRDKKAYPRTIPLKELFPFRRPTSNHR